VDFEFERMRKWSWSNLKYYSSISLEDLKKNTKGPKMNVSEPRIESGTS
jgi:hypothetical protein